MKIGELANVVGLNPITIRYYESRGLLLSPERTQANYRVYGEAEAQRLRFIKQAKRLGFSLQDIMGILRLYDLREPTCSHVATLLDQKLDHVESLLRELRHFKSQLVKLREAAGEVQDCRPSGGHVCKFIETSEVELSDQAYTHVNSSEGSVAKRRRPAPKPS